jgi:hypothetical protein
MRFQLIKNTLLVFSTALGAVPSMSHEPMTHGTWAHGDMGALLCEFLLSVDKKKKNMHRLWKV